MALRLKRLDELARLTLEHLPTAPNGLSLAELADGLLGHADPVSRGRMRSALVSIGEGLGVGLDGLVSRWGDDELGHARIALYGLPKRMAGRIRSAINDPTR